MGKNFTYLCLAVLATVLAAWSLNWMLVTDDERGTFGDMFGVTTSLFSGLALGGVIITLLLQRHELALQREELRLTRQELKKAADAQQLAQEAMKDQVHFLSRHARILALAKMTELADDTPGPCDLGPDDTRWGDPDYVAPSEKDHLLARLKNEYEQLYSGKRRYPMRVGDLAEELGVSAEAVVEFINARVKSLWGHVSDAESVVHEGWLPILREELGPDRTH